MSKSTQPQPSQDTTTILAAVGEKGTNPSFSTISHSDFFNKIGGTVKGIALSKSTAIFFDINRQGTVLLDPANLTGILALCGVDSNGNPTSLADLKQATKYAKLFRKNNKAKKGAS